MNCWDDLGLAFDGGGTFELMVVTVNVEQQLSVRGLEEGVYLGPASYSRHGMLSFTLRNIVDPRAPQRRCIKRWRPGAYRCSLAHARLRRNHHRRRHISWNESIFRKTTSGKNAVKHMPLINGDYMNIWQEGLWYLARLQRRSKRTSR